MVLEDRISEWLFDHCINVTSVSGSYSETTITGATTAKYQVNIQSGITEDLDELGPLLLSGTVNDPDLDPDTTYILAVSQGLGDDVEYEFSSTGTVSGTLDWLVQTV